MALIKIEHPELGLQKTRLSADVAAGATSSTVENFTGFTTNDYVIFGKLGEEKSELVILTSTTTPATLGHTTGPIFAHSARTPITEIKYNQVKIYSSTSEDGTYSLLTTIALQPDKAKTEYDDTTGDSTTWYKVKYYNSTTTALSDYSDAVQATGYTSESLREMTDEVLEDFGDRDSKEVSRKQVRRYLRQGVKKLSVFLIKSLPDYLRAYTTQSLTSGTATYDLPTGFLAFNRVDVNLTGTTASSAKKADFQSEFEGESDTTYYTNEPKIFFRGETFGIRPTPAATGTAFLWYWAYPTEMDDDGDTHGLPYGASEALVFYSLWRLWRNKDRDRAADYKEDFEDSVKDWLEFAAQARQQATNRKVEIIFGNDLYDWVE